MVRSWTVVVLLVLSVAFVGCPNGPAKKTGKGTVEIKVPTVVTPKVTPPKPKVTPPKPKVTPPKPKVEAPKPKVEAPKPKVEAPKPKVEAPKAALKQLKPGLMAVDITALLNSDAITDEADRNDADLDEWKQSFPAENLPKAGTFEPKDVKTAFTFPDGAKGKKNNVACAGQTLPLAGRAKALHLLVTATDGNQEDKITINYANASVQADLKVTDWCGKAAFGEKAGVVSPKRVAVDSGGQGIRAPEDKPCTLWVVSIPLDAKRDLKSVKLPYNSLVHIFAVTLAK